MSLKKSLCISVLLLLVASFAQADPLKEILYTKKTTLLYPKTYDFTFSLWTDAASTDPADMVWSEDQSITLSSPKLTTYLGKVTPLNISDFTQQLWVQVEYQKKTGITKVVGTRDRLSIVPYALQSFSSQTVLSSGAVTSITPIPGSGITSNQTAGDVTLSTDPSILQTRISGTCSSGSAIKGINVNGAVDCEPTGTGTITGVTAGTGLIGGGTSGNVTLDVDFGTGTNQAAKGDHNHNGIYQKKYGKVAVVAQSGGDYTDPVAAMGDLSAWCGTPSATNPCLLKIMPGVYDIGTNSLQMQPFVDIEGSGENVTVIQGAIEGESLFAVTNAVLIGSSNAELRRMTIKNIGPGTVVVAILNSGASPMMTNITAIASGVSDIAGIVNQSSSSPVMSKITVKTYGGLANNIGIFNRYSSPRMSHVTADASDSSYINFGMVNLGSAPIIRHVSATAFGAASTNYGIINQFESASSMIDVVAKASGGETNIGMFNGDASEASVQMMNVRASATGGTRNFGIHNLSTVGPIMTNVTATANEGTQWNFGIYNRNASPIMLNVSAQGINGTIGLGMNNDVLGGTTTTFTITADRSSFEGTTASIDSAPVYTLRLGANKLIGAINGTGAYQCINSYNGTTYTALDATCQ